MRAKREYIIKLLSFFAIIIGLGFTTIGYAVFNADLSISGEAIVKASKTIRIVNSSFNSSENDAYEEYNHHSTIDSIDYYINLPNENSSVIYKLDIINYTNKDYGIAKVTGLPSNLTYEFVGYSVGDKICSNITCNNGVTDEVYLKIKYKQGGYDPNNVYYSSQANIVFEHFYNIVYFNVENSALLPKKILRQLTYTAQIQIPEEHILVVKMNGLPLTMGVDYTYDTETNRLTVPNVLSNLVISIEDANTQYDVTNTGGGKAFAYYDTGYDINTQTFFLEADLSTITLSEVFENIISIGHNIDYWDVKKPTGVNLHVYYPETKNTDILEIDVTTTNASSSNTPAKITKHMSFSNNKIFRLAFNSNGLYINGKKMFDSSSLGEGVSSSKGNISEYLSNYFDIWSNNPNNHAVGIGSVEGNKRSYAQYREIKIYNNHLTATQMIEKTTVLDEEYGEYEEIGFTSIQTLSLGNNAPVEAVFPFSPNNSKFLFRTPNFIDLNTNSVYIEMDVSTLSEDAKLENLISIGNNFNNWIANGTYDIHFYYPYKEDKEIDPETGLEIEPEVPLEPNILVMALLNDSDKSAQFRNTVPLINGSIIKMAFSRYGLYINGEKWMDSAGYFKPGTTMWGNKLSDVKTIKAFFERFLNPPENTQFKFGSEQGDNRSNAIYNDVRIYNGSLIERDLQELTSN